MSKINQKGSPAKFLSILQNRIQELSASEDIMSSDTGENQELSKEEIIDWLADHNQVWEDICDYFGTENIENLSYDEILDWIYNHDQLSEDFEMHFGYPVDDEFWNVEECDKITSAVEITDDYVEELEKDVEEKLDSGYIVWDKSEDALFAMVNTDLTRGDVGIEGDPETEWIFELTYDFDELDEDPEKQSEEIIEEINSIIENPEIINDEDIQPVDESEDIMASEEFVRPPENNVYWYFTKHGIGPGSVPKGLDILDTAYMPEGDYFLTDVILTTDSLNKYDIKEAVPKTRYFKVMKYTPGSLEDGISGDEFAETLTSANDTKEAFEKFQNMGLYDISIEDILPADEQEYRDWYTH